MTQAPTRAISIARAITRSAGLRIPSGKAETFTTRLFGLELSPAMKGTLSPLRNIIEVCDDELAAADEQFEAMVVCEPMVKRLTTLPGIGPITPTAFVAALDTVSRFGRAGQVTSYPAKGCACERVTSTRIAKRLASQSEAIPLLYALYPWHLGAGARDDTREEQRSLRHGSRNAATYICALAPPA